MGVTDDGETTFSQECWKAIEPVRAAIDIHPFIRGLESGGLSRRAFGIYLVQHALLLVAYARAQADAAAQARTPDEIVFWATAAQDAIAGERAMAHDRVVDVTGAIASPTTTAYTNHMLALAAGGSYEVLAAGLLPAFWIYEDVGRRLKQRALDSRGALEGHPFGDWITRYGDPEYAASTQRAVAMVDHLADTVSSQRRERMRAAFITGSRYEWMFWDAAYRGEVWPI